MKRLLYIQNMFGMGGINKITAVKENYLVNHDFEVHNLNVQNKDGLSPEGMYDPKIILHYIELSTLDKLQKIPFIGRLLRYVYYRFMLLRDIFTIKPDWIIVTMPILEPKSVVWFTFWKKRIMEFHGWYNHPAPRRYTLSEKIDFRLKYPFYKIVALTQGEADKLERITNNQVDVIPNSQFVSTTMVSDCSSKRVITLARFSPEKKLPAFLPVWKRIMQKHPDWELNIYGEGPDEPKMREIIEKNKLNTVFIHPYTKNSVQELSNSSIYILPSNSEGFPLVIVESMAVGVPCVSYDCPFGPAAIIRDGEDGFLTEPNNPDQMADKILYLIEHDDVRKEMGRKARRNIARFNIDNIMAKWIKIFNS